MGMKKLSKAKKRLIDDTGRYINPDHPAIKSADRFTARFFKKWAKEKGYSSRDVAEVLTKSTEWSMWLVWEPPK